MIIASTPTVKELKDIFSFLKSIMKNPVKNNDDIIKAIFAFLFSMFNQRKVIKKINSSNAKA